MIRIVSSPATDKNKYDPKRMTEVIFYGVGKEFSSLGSFVFEDKIHVEVRPYRRSKIVVVRLNMNDAIADRAYRSDVRSLLGSQFGRFVLGRVRSHRRRGIVAERPSLSARRTDLVIENIVAKLSTRPMPAHEQVGSQLATP